VLANRIGPAVAIAALLAACGAGATTTAPIQTTPSARAHVSAGHPEHVAVILMENHEYGDIIGQATTPYINRLARRYALATSMYAVSHPSLPNYLALTGGSTFGIDSDCTDCGVGATSVAAGRR
jgi:acid phosphatase